jgi:hypothetical protein
MNPLLAKACHGPLATVTGVDWRTTLRNHAHSMRKTLMGNSILCDLILIRSALSLNRPDGRS